LRDIEGGLVENGMNTIRENLERAAAKGWEKTNTGPRPFCAKWFGPVIWDAKAVRVFTITLNKEK
jgi:hypothetical protein